MPVTLYRNMLFGALRILTCRISLYIDSTTVTEMEYLEAIFVIQCIVCMLVSFYGLFQHEDE